MQFLININQTGYKVSSSIENSVTLINNQPANNLPNISDDMKTNIA